MDIGFCRCTRPRSGSTDTSVSIRVLTSLDRPLSEMDDFDQTFLSFSTNGEVCISIVVLFGYVYVSWLEVVSVVFT